ncbi:MAG: magnesium-translocating P-type ATPase [Aquabacterium sp.]
MRAAPPSAPRGDADAAALRHLAAVPVAQALEALASSQQGLTASQVEAARTRFGLNRVAQAQAHGLWRQLLARLFNPLHLLLLTLAAVSLLTGNAESAVIILLIMGLSVTLAFLQERRSDRAAAALRAMVHTQATVLRRATADATAVEEDVPIEQLVPGDVVHLSAGDLVPADVRLLSARDFFVNEASLTGESLPVEKHAGECAADADTMAPHNVCFMGTHVASGSATAVVVHTGGHAVFGAIADSMAAATGDSSFDQGVRRFTWLMLRFMAVMVPLVFIVNGLGKGDWLEALLFATAVAVGLTPEMLPMLVTVNLARGAMKMSRRKVIVKHLPAIQDVGAMDVLCTDKTGTLTQDRVILEKYIDLNGQPSDWVLDFAYLNSCYQSGLKSQLDQAVLRYTEVHARLHEGGNYQKVDELPFDFQRRRMSVLVEGQGQHLLICKGAVEEVFAACGQAESGGRRFPLDATHLPQAREVSRALNEDGFRVIAIAYKPLPMGHPPLTLADESDLVLLGFIAFLDPPKEGVREALAALHRDGVAVKILTGDNEVVTRKICRDVDLPMDKVLLGPAIEAMSDVQLNLEVDGTQVFARLTPAQKARVIEALRQRGHVVGYLGDGINDGPALKAAHVGVSVDTAVDIAKESADIILLEKSLMVLHDGVIEGRRVFANLLKYIRMGASSSFGNMLSMLGASLWLPFLPMAPIQVLANNLLYDLSQTAIPTDHVDREELARPRRWELDHIARFMLTIGPVSSLFDYATFALLYFAFHASTPDQAALFHTGWFLESLLSQTLVIHVIRTGRLPFVRSRASWPLTATTLGVCALGLWLPVSPLAPALGLTAMPGGYWPLLALVVAGYLLLTAAAVRALRHGLGGRQRGCGR